MGIYEFLRETSDKYGRKPAFFGRRPTSQGEVWTSLSYFEVREKAEKLACKLRALGLQKGDRVLLFAHSRPEFAVEFFATPLAGGVIVPLDMKLNLRDQQFIYDFSEARFILCSHHEDRKAAEKIAQNSWPQPLIVVVEEALAEAVIEPQTPHSDLTHSALKAEDVFILPFTSGTTNQPKAAMLTFANVQYQMESAAKAFQGLKEFRLLSILPLHHMLEITMGFLLPFSQGGQVFYANSLIPHQLIAYFKEKKIRSLIGVPLFLRTLKKGILSEIQTSPWKKIWFSAAFYISSLLPFKPLRRFLFFPLHRQLGGELQYFISGASALDPKVASFFETLGLPVYEGFGMTETSPVIAFSHPGSSKRGCVGKALPGVELRLHPTSQELLVRGPMVMKGYFKNPEATSACLTEDGWLNTGDLASIDPEGFVRILGRNKDLIVLGNGKKVVPEEVENYLREISGIQDICVIGTKADHGATKGTDVVTAVVVIHPSDKIHQERIQQELNQVSQSLSYYKRPSKFVFLTESLPKTTTQKIKKNLIKDLIAPM